MAATQSLVQKILARAAGRSTVAAGETVPCRIDVVLLDEGAGAAALEALRQEPGLLAPGRPRCVLALEGELPHDRPAPPEGFDAVYRGLGLAPLVLAQAGHLRPGALALAAGTALGGALGAFSVPIDAERLRTALAEGALPLRVPPTCFLRWNGRLADGVSAHDMALLLRALAGTAVVRDVALEHGGEAVAALTMGERMTLAAASPGLGACAGLFAADVGTALWLHDAGMACERGELARWRSDDDAPGERIVLEAGALAPLVVPMAPAEAAGTDAAPGLPQPIDEMAHTRVSLACLAGAEGGKLSDLRAAARVLAGFRVAAGVRLLVAPASRLDRELAAREGVLRRLVEAGATLLPDARVPPQTIPGTLISACDHPFADVAGPRAAAQDPGRAGVGSAVDPPRTLLRASPYTVAATALRGVVSDARSMLA